MKVNRLKKIVLLFVVPSLFILWYLFALAFTNIPIVNIMYTGLSGNELMIIGAVATFEFLVEIYSMKGKFGSTGDEVLDKEFLLNLVVFSLSLLFYAVLRYIMAQEISSLHSDNGPSELFIGAFFTSVTFGVVLIVWSLRTLKNLKSYI